MTYQRSKIKFEKGTLGTKRGKRGCYFQLSQFEGQNNKHLYCLSDSTVILSFELVQFYGHWRNRYSIDLDVPTPLGLTDSEYKYILELYQLALYELTTPMCDNLNQTLEQQNQLLTTIANLLETISQNGESTMPELPPITNTNTITVNCGCGCNGQTTTTPPGGTTPIYPPLSPPLSPGELPEGFTDLESYQLYKCQQANLIFDSLVVGLQSLQTVINTGYGSAFLMSKALAEMLTLFWLTEVNFLFICIAVLKALNTINTPINSLFNQIVDELNNRRESLVCAMYNAPNTESAIQDTIALLTDVATTIIESYFMPIKAILLEMLGSTLENTITSNRMNDLFQFVSGTIYANADCSNCGGSEPQTLCYTLTEPYTEPKGVLFEHLQTTKNGDLWKITPVADDLGNKIADIAFSDLNSIRINGYVVDIQLSNMVKATVNYVNSQGDYVTGPDACCSRIEIYNQDLSDWHIIATVDSSKMNNCAGCLEALPQGPWRYPVAVYATGINANIEPSPVFTSITPENLLNNFGGGPGGGSLTFDPTSQGDRFLFTVYDFGELITLDKLDLCSDGYNVECESVELPTANDSEYHLLLTDSTDFINAQGYFTATSVFKWLETMTNIKNTHSVNITFRYALLARLFGDRAGSPITATWKNLRVWSTPTG